MDPNQFVNYKIKLVLISDLHKKKLNLYSFSCTINLSIKTKQIIKLVKFLLSKQH